MIEPKPLSYNPMFGIVDQAIRKEISWHEARARLHDLVLEEPDLFAAVIQLQLDRDVSIVAQAARNLR